jgi:hypothetical protein
MSSEARGNHKLSIDTTFDPKFDNFLLWLSVFVDFSPNIWRLISFDFPFLLSASAD